MADEEVFSGAGGYARLTRTTAGGKTGALLEISNPNSKVNTVPPEALAEIGGALDAVEADADVKFVVFHGGEGKVHAGADVTMFAGGLAEDEDPPNYAAVNEYLKQGAALDVRIKRLSAERTTVSIMHGERFGGSVEWPLMASYCVAEAGAGIQFSEVNIGILPGWDGVLNVLLKSGPTNALYMGATGARLDAGQMEEAGIVDDVTDSDKLMVKALELAAEAPPVAERGGVKGLVATGEFFKLLSDRLNVGRYQALRDEVAGQQGEMEPKEFSRHVDKQLAGLGKPCAPLAVESVFGLVAKAAGVDPADLDAVEKLAFEEAARCGELMRTRDRVIGIDSILRARENPLNKIAIFTRS